MRAATVAANLIRRYGRRKVRRLVEGFERGVADARLADALDLGVSGERVRQWRHALGWEWREYRVHPDVAAMAPPWTGDTGVFPVESSAAV